MAIIADRYEPTGRAVWGGMGQVNECNDLHLGRKVILKAVQRQGDLPRLMDERKALLKLRSRHVAQLLDVVTFEWMGNEVTCLVLEYIDGKEIGTFIGKPVEHTKALWQIAAGIADIHAAGVIHRDIKPQNIMVDANGVVKIIDFGLSREVGVDDRTRSIIGTDGYMAPELFSNRTIAFTNAIDVFALGQTARALYGKPPQGRAPQQIPPGTIAAEAPGISPDLANIIERCLATNPQERPAVQEVVSVLESALLFNQHRARLIDTHGTPYDFHAGNRTATIQWGVNSISIRYDGFSFKVTRKSGSVFINNQAIDVGASMTTSCVITLGTSASSGQRAFLTFDVSNPEVMP